MSTYDFLASKAKRMRKRLSRVTGDYRQALSNYQSAYKTYTKEFEEAEEAKKFRDKYGSKAVKYMEDRKKKISTKYYGDEGKFGKLESAYLTSLGTATKAKDTGIASVDAKYYGTEDDPDTPDVDESTPGLFGSAFETYKTTISDATTNFQTSGKNLITEYFGTEDDPDTDVDESSVGKFGESAAKYSTAMESALATYTTDKGALDTKYLGVEDDPETDEDETKEGLFDTAYKTYTSALSGAETTFNTGMSNLTKEYFGDPDDDTSVGKYEKALNTYTSAINTAGTTYDTTTKAIETKYYGTEDDPSTGKFSIAEKDYLGKVEAIGKEAVAKDKTAFETHYGIADDPTTKDVDEFKRGKIHDVQDTFKDTTDLGKRLSGMSDRYGIDVIGYAGNKDHLKALGKGLRDTLGTVVKADTDIRNVSDPYGVYGEAMWGYDVLTKWLKGEVDDKYKDYQRLGSRAMEALGLSMSGIKAEGGRIYEKYQAGAWWERSTKWRDITHKYSTDFLTGQLEKMYSDTGVKQIEDDIGFLTGTKYNFSGQSVKARPDPISFDKWMEGQSAITYFEDGSHAYKSKDEMMELYYKDVMGKKNFDTIYDSEEYKDYLGKVEGVHTSYSDAYDDIYGEGGYVETETGKETTSYKSLFEKLTTDYGKEYKTASDALYKVTGREDDPSTPDVDESMEGSAKTTYDTQIGLLDTAFQGASKTLLDAYQKVVGIQDDPDTEEDESVIGTAEQTYTSSLSKLETDYKTKLGKITKAYTDVAGDDENKGSALTTFETEKGSLTTEYEAAKKAIEDAYYGIVGKEGTDEEEGIIGSAKTAYDTLMKQLNLDYKAETGAFTSAYEKTKTELDEKYETDTGALTGEYNEETGGITSETGYTDAHGKFLTGKEWYEKEEKELTSAYETLFGKDETDEGLQGLFTSAKKSYDTLQADYAKLASRVKKYERLGLVDPVMKSKKYRAPKALAGSYL